MSVPKRILCPIDFDEYSGRALARAQDLALRHSAELRLLHVLPSRTGVAGQVDRAGGTHLDELVASIRASGVRCKVTTLHGDPAFQILQAARDGEADLVVMATHGRKGMSRVVLGSVTEAVAPRPWPKGVQGGTKGLLVCGIFSSLLYTAIERLCADAVRGIQLRLSNGQRAVRIGAPTRPPWVLLGIVYTLLVIAFGSGVRASARRNRPLRVLGGLMVAYGLIGLAWPLAPMHRRGDQLTLTDTVAPAAWYSASG